MVAINPFKKVPLYGNDYIEAYKRKSIESPHVYAITDTAIREMRRGNFTYNNIKRLSFLQLRYSLQIVINVLNSYFGSFSSRWSKSIYHNKVSRFWPTFCNSCKSFFLYGWVHLLSIAFNSRIVTLIILCMSAQSYFSYRYSLHYFLFDYNCCVCVLSCFFMQSTTPVYLPLSCCQQRIFVELEENCAGKGFHGSVGKKWFWTSVPISFTFG